MPWLSKNSTRKRAGNVPICSGSADQTAAACGTITRSTNGSETPSVASHSPSEGSPGEVSSSRARRWKRGTSATIRWKAGESRCERLA